MKLTVFTHDSLEPANHGYRVDVVRRLRHLRDLGMGIQLVSLARGKQPAWGQARGLDYADESLTLGRAAQAPFHQALARTATGLPWPAACRTLRSAFRDRVCSSIQQFAPDAFLVEGLYSAPLAYWMQSRIPGKVPKILYRSHNIEYQYMANQLRAEKNARQRVNLWLSNAHLEAYERGMLTKADWVYDISCDDLAYWLRQGYTRIRWLPPLSDGAGPRPPSRKPEWDMAYCGNLHAPNNVEAVQWFVMEVMPLVRERFPQATLVVAGSQPSAELLAICTGHDFVTVVADPADITAIYDRSRILVNPALRGSGVNIKTIDMLYSGKDMIVSKVGAAGLSAGIQQAVAVNMSPQEFADKACEFLSMSTRANAGHWLVQLEREAHEGMAHLASQVQVSGG